jgi:predicted RNase H-like HicB family nuclease
MTRTYHVTVARQGTEWRATCPALQDHGAVTGGDTREEALTHIENVILMILEEMQSAGAAPPPDVAVTGGIPLTIDFE